MQNLRKPYWLLIINTLPVAIFFFLAWSEFNVIKTLLYEENIRLWNLLGTTLLGLGILNCLYSVFLIVSKTDVPVNYCFTALIVYICYIYGYYFHFEDLIPFSVPDWMYSQEIFFYAGTFLMPTLVYCLFLIVLHFTQQPENHKAWKNLVSALTIPLAWYLFYQILLPLFRYVDSPGEHSMFVLYIISLLLFLFFIIRSVYLVVARKHKRWKKYRFLWEVPITIICPFVGLMLNASFSGVFGDFYSYWFYILAVVNGLLLCLPNTKCKVFRLLLFAGRCICFSYTLYFFIVFLPFLPLSIPIIVLFGAGLLMLAPIILFVIHINKLSYDFTFLKRFYAVKLLQVIILAGFLIIPTIITLSYLSDKKTLNEALSYVYTPDYSKKYNINKNSLSRTIQAIESNRKRNDFLFEGTTPYLSSYYQWLVLDNLTLSNSKISTLKSIFKGGYFEIDNRDIIRNEGVSISDISTNSVYENGMWRTWVNLEITNNGTNSNEYSTILNLPDGCWISDYYLYVGDRKEPGILAEKKSAMWIFSQIRDTNRDPGILYYLTGNRVSFRVFPFFDDEIRKTGIEFLHKEPLTISFDGHLVALGNIDEAPESDIITTEQMIYIPASKKKQLAKVQRQPYLHFMVNTSRNQKEHADYFQKDVEKILQDYPQFKHSSRVSFVNAYLSSSMKVDDQWIEAFKSQPFEGGFFIERAIRQALFETFEKNDNTYPIFIVVTDNMEGAIIQNNFYDFKMLFPESDMFYILRNGKLESHSLISSPLSVLEEDVHPDFRYETLMYSSGNEVYYLPNNESPSIILRQKEFDIQSDNLKEKDWHSAMFLQGKWLSHVLCPYLSETEWLDIIKSSFMTKIMTPYTSYIVVENEAQKAAMLRKQQQVLTGNKSLDVSDEVINMSEPGTFVLALLLVICLVMVRRYNKKQII